MDRMSILNTNQLIRMLNLPQISPKDVTTNIGYTLRPLCIPSGF